MERVSKKNAVLFFEIVKISSKYMKNYWFNDVVWWKKWSRQFDTRHLKWSSILNQIMILAGNIIDTENIWLAIANIAIASHTASERRILTNNAVGYTMFMHSLVNLVFVCLPQNVRFSLDLCDAAATSDIANQIFSVLLIFSSNHCLKNINQIHCMQYT